MATTQVSYERLVAGELPPVCIKSGALADGLVEARFGRLPPWTFLLLLAGILPFVIALFFAHETIRCQVPVQRHVIERYHRLSRQATVGWAVSGVSGIIAVLGVYWLWMVAFAGVALVVWSWFQRAVGWVDAHPVRGTPLVELRRVSPEFAAVVKA